MRTEELIRESEAFDSEGDAYIHFEAVNFQAHILMSGDTIMLLTGIAAMILKAAQMYELPLWKLVWRLFKTARSLNKDTDFVDYE